MKVITVLVKFRGDVCEPQETLKGK